MAETVSDLLVRITPEGIDETADQLEQTQDSFQETADIAGEGAAQLEGFADRWSGAMMAITGALLAGSAALLSQVPVLGESMAGLNAIIDAFALRLDSLLRPALGNVNNSLFEFANFVHNADGALGILFDAISAIVGIGGTLLVGVAAIGSQMGIWASTIAGVSSMLATLGGWIASTIAGIGSFIASSTAALAAVGAFIGILGVAALEMSGVLDAVQNLGSEMAGPMVNAALTLTTILTGPLLVALSTLGAAIVGFVRGFLEGGLSEGFARAKENAIRAFDIIKERVAGTLEDLASAALGFGRSLVNSFIMGIRQKIDNAARAAERLASKVQDYMPSSPAETGPLSDLDDAGPGLVDTIAEGMDRSSARLERASGRVASAADLRNRESGARGMSQSSRSDTDRQLQQLVAAMQRRRQETTLQLDGKTVARQLKPLLGEGAVASGATQVRR